MMRGGEMMNKYTIKIRTFDDRQLIFNVVAVNLIKAIDQVNRKMHVKGFRRCDYEIEDFDVKR